MGPSGTIKVNNVSLYYELSGQGPPLVFICGLGTDLTVFESITSKLAEHHQVLTFDNRGAGRSEQPDEPYSISMMVTDTLGLMDALSIEQADIVGLSMGGKIAMELAATHPERVRRLVLLSTAAKGQGKLVMSLPMRVLWLLRWLPIFRKKYPQSKAAHARQLQASVTYDGSAKVASIKAPTLILHGQRDRSVPVELAQELHDKISNSKLALFRGGHMFALFTQQPDVLTKIEDFLAD